MLKKIGLYALLVAGIPFAMLEIAFRFLPVSYPPHLMPVTAQEPVTRETLIGAEERALSLLAASHVALAVALVIMRVL